MMSLKFYPRRGFLLFCIIIGSCCAESTLPKVQTIPVHPISSTTNVSTTPITISTSPETNPTDSITSTVTASDITTPSATTPTTASSTTATPAPTTTTTPPPTTTPSTTTTPAPTTTTTPPPTTTPSTTTTPAPTTTTTPPPTPAPAPTPLPPATLGSWNYTDGKNFTCIMVEFAGRLNVTYESVNQTLAQALLNVPADARVTDGSCAGDQWLKLSWPNTTWANNLTMKWHLNETTKMYALSEVNIILTPDTHFPNASSKSPIELSVVGQVWTTPLLTSYRCTAPLHLALNEDATGGATSVADLTIDQLKEEAYRNSTSNEFSTARYCTGADVPDVVPIAVGCALGALVIIVLVAYFIGRRRSTHGYLSM